MNKTSGKKYKGSPLGGDSKKHKEMQTNNKNIKKEGC